jgi:hypothetical protein
MPLVATPFDYSVFAQDEKKKPKGVIELEGKLSDIAATMPGATPKEKMRNAIQTEEGKELQNQIVNRNFLELQRKEATRLSEGVSDAEKARTTEQVRRLVTTRLQEEMMPLQFKEIVFDKDTNDFIVPIPGSEEAKKFYAMRQRIVKNVFENAGLLRGNRLLDRNVADAISPFAEVDYNTLTVKTFRDSAGSSVDEPARSSPRPGTSSVAPASTAPETVQRRGRVDFSKLQAGKAYKGISGKSIQVWNGSGWQKPEPNSVSFEDALTLPMIYDEEQREVNPRKRNRG